MKTPMEPTQTKTVNHVTMPQPADMAYVTTYLNGTPSVFQLDGGAPYSMVSRQKYHLIPPKFRPPLRPLNREEKLLMADGISEMKILGITEMPVRVFEENIVYTLLVVEMKHLDGIWGMDFQRKYDCYPRPALNKVYFRGQEHPWIDVKHKVAGHAVHLIKPVKLGAGSECIAVGKLNSPFKTKELTIFEPNPYTRHQHGVLAGKQSQVQGKRSPTALVHLCNPTDEEVSIPAGTVVGHLYPADASKGVTSLGDDSEELQPFPFSCAQHKEESGLVEEPRSDGIAGQTDNEMSHDEKTRHSKCTYECFTLQELEEAVPEYLDDLYIKSKETLQDDDEKKKLAGALIRNQKAFASGPFDIGKTDVLEHSIDTGDAAPVRLPLRRHGPVKEKAIRDTVEKCLGAGVVEPSVSPWATAPVVSWKPDMTPRVCMDFRRLNSLVKFDSYPLPKFEDCIDCLHGSKYYCSVDLQMGYWQVPLRREDREKTAFLTKDGLFQFVTLPCGLNNAGATFERLMEHVLRGYQWKRCLIYLDDILTFGSTFDETLLNLELVLNRLHGAKLKLKPKKCHLMQESLIFLGHRISSQGIETMSSKIDSVKNWPSPGALPKSKRRAECKKFLGLVSYYRRFIKGMSTIAAPIYALMKSSSDLEWTLECEAAFIRLKAALISAPVLAFPDLEAGGFILDCDASSTGHGAVLSQLQNGEEKVIGYYSKLLSDAERNYCITKREFLSCVRAVSNFRPYLFGQKFLIRTDNSAVSYMMSLRDSSPQIHRWQLFLSQFTFDIIHRSASRHANADVMSRLMCEQCGREELTADQPKQKVKYVRKAHKKPAPEVPSCVHTRCTDESIDEEVEDLMLTCSVLTRAQARAMEQQGGHMDDGTSNDDIPSGDHMAGGSDSTSGDTIPSATPGVNMESGSSVKSPTGPPHTLNPDQFSYEKLREAQLTDPDIGPILQLKETSNEYPDYRAVSAESRSVKALRQHWRRLFVNRGVLYRRVEKEDQSYVQLVLPSVLRPVVLHQLHNCPTAGHLGTYKTLERIKRRFYWVGWRRNVMRYVSHCTTCNTVKRPHTKQKVPLTQQLFCEAFERISIDLIGPLPRTRRGHRFAVTMECNFTKWVEVAPLRTEETIEIADAIFRELVSRFGCMYNLHSDRGPQFTSQVYTTLLKKLDVTHSLTTAYNPKSSGLIENFNKVLKSMIKTYVEDHHQSTGEWDVMLPYFLMAYRSSVHSSTGETPHFMLTAREMRIPLDLVYAGPSEAVVALPDYVQEMERRIHKAYAIVRNRLKDVQRVQKRQYETAIPRFRALRPGNKVWYYNPLKKFKGDQHKPWKGPYKVISVADDLTVLLDVGGGQQVRTHSDKLRLMH